MPDGNWSGDVDSGPPFEVIEPARVTLPIVLNSPHSGASYPRRFLELSCLDSLSLRRSEDAFMGELAAPCVALGAPLLRANFPRAYLDVNREPFELDPQMFAGHLPSFANTRSLRVAAGLGSIPRVVGEAQPIYRQQLKVEDAMERITNLYRPYHAALEGLIARSHQLFGLSILIDLHSMPSSSADVAGCDIVLGDRFGSSAAGWIVDELRLSLRAAGLSVRHNKPYAGGYITERYGRPVQKRHAVQIELNRALYMDERSVSRLPTASAVSNILVKAIAALAKVVVAANLGQSAAE